MIAKGSENNDSGSIKVEGLLYSLAKLFSEVQRALDLHSRALAQDLREFGTAGFLLTENRIIRLPDEASGGVPAESLPLLSLVSFRKYRISELIIKFGAVRENYDPSTGQAIFRIVPFGSREPHVHSAHISISGENRVLAELQVGGEIRETLVLGSR